MRVIIRRTALLLVLALSAPLLCAQENEALFISSRPLGAAVFLNGRALAEKTPLLIRDLAPGAYRIDLIKEGFLTTRAELDFLGQKATAVSYRLTRDGIALDPEVDSLTLRGTPIPGAEEGILLQPGAYTMAYDDETLNIEPIYPRNGTIQALDILAPSLIILGGFLMGQELFDDQEETFTISPLSVGIATVGAALGIGDIRLRVDRRDYLEGSEIRPVHGVGDTQGEELLDKAAAILATGATAEAAALYSRFVVEHPDSYRLPEALYSLGRLHLIEGKLDLAAAEFRLILERYPAASVFDKSCKALADYYALIGEYEAAATALDSIVYYDPAFNEAEISALANAYREEAAAEVVR